MLSLRCSFALWTTSWNLAGATGLVVARVALIFPLVATRSVFDAEHHSLKAESGLRVTLSETKSMVSNAWRKDDD